MLLRCLAHYGTQVGKPGQRHPTACPPEVHSWSPGRGGEEKYSRAQHSCFKHRIKWSTQTQPHEQPLKIILPSLAWLSAPPLVTPRRRGHRAGSCAPPAPSPVPNTLEAPGGVAEAPGGTHLDLLARQLPAQRCGKLRASAG